MKTPILSIVIPTKDRYYTLISIVKYFLSWDRTDFEVIVQDNSANNSIFLEELGGVLDDLRLKYFHIKNPIPMISNCSEAISHAEGEYICFIGDDDGLIESTIDLCKWLKDQNYESASFQRFRYDWPNLSQKLNKNTPKNGVLISRSFEATLLNVNPKEELKRYLKSGATNIIYKGPFPYNGLVSRRIFKETLKLTGKYFPAPTPDVACMVSSALLTEKHAYIKLPYICGGQSLNSAAGLGRRGMHVGEVKNITSLPSDTAQKWSSELPRFWSGFTINAESTIKAIESWHREDLRDIFNFNRTIAATLIYLQPEYRKRAWDHVKQISLQKSSNVNCNGVILEVFMIQLSRVWHLVKRKLSNTQNSYHPDIGRALDYIQKEMSEKYPNLAPKIKYEADIFAKKV